MSQQQKLAGRSRSSPAASKGIALPSPDISRPGRRRGGQLRLHKAGADKVVSEITSTGGKAVAVQADVAKKSDIDRLFAETRKAFGQPDILVNNAGFMNSCRSIWSPRSIFTGNSIWNVLGLILTTQEAVKHFPAAGGSVINISSVASTAAPATGSVYSATKGAVDAVTKSLAKELGPRRIRVNAINPGMVETEGFHSAGIAESDFQKAVESQTPLGRIGQPQDIAGAAVFFASPDSAWITGETFVVSGGYR